MFDIQLLKYKHLHWFYLFFYHIYYKESELIINRVQVCKSLWERLLNRFEYKTLHDSISFFIGMDTVI